MRRVEDVYLITEEKRSYHRIVHQTLRRVEDVYLIIKEKRSYHRIVHQTSTFLIVPPRDAAITALLDKVPVSVLLNGQNEQPHWYPVWKPGVTVD
jgi:hypothetical protein